MMFASNAKPVSLGDSFSAAEDEERIVGKAIVSAPPSLNASPPPTVVMNTTHSVSSEITFESKAGYCNDHGPAHSLLVEANFPEANEKGSVPNGPISVALTSISRPPSAIPSNATPHIPSENTFEGKAVSMLSNDHGPTLSIPAEVSLANPAVPCAFEESPQKTPTTSNSASASVGKKSPGSNLINISEQEPWSTSVPLTAFDNADTDFDFPQVLTFKGVSVTLENNGVWKQFSSCGTEMIITKQGRRMFPYCRYRLSGLDPDRVYCLVLSIVPSSQFKYRWNSSKWEITGNSEHQPQGLVRAFPHHYSPSRGSYWTNTLVSFYKLKLTNNFQDHDGHFLLYSMHRYIPRLHVIPVPDGNIHTANQPMVMGPESMTFTFPQTEFMAVTTYQNFRITQLKINHNPFAKGFREDGNNLRLKKVLSDVRAVGKSENQLVDLKIAPSSEYMEVMDASTKSLSDFPPTKTKLVLKPIMSNTASNAESFVSCIRGKHSLGELVLVQKSGQNKVTEKSTTSGSPEMQQDERGSQFTKLRAGTPTSSPRHHLKKSRKRVNRRWANPRGKPWKARAALPAISSSSSINAATQPELDDIDGLLFVSFISKEALEVHVGDSPVSTTPPESEDPLMEPIQSEQMTEIIPETEEGKINHFESVLLNELRVLKYRQVIHPVLQEVGLKLSSLDVSSSVDLQYLGVTLPPGNLAATPNVSLPSTSGGLPFISRTGKTSDMTKIKGWKTKFMTNDAAPLSSCEGQQKNLSAFCSNMLDEYLKSEEQQISERADAFSSNTESSVAYQLPERSSSYVKTLDSALKHRNVAFRLPVGASRPCPLSYKPVDSPALSSKPSAARPGSPCKKEPQLNSTHSLPNSQAGLGKSNDVLRRLPTYDWGAIQQRQMSSDQNHELAQKSSGFSRAQWRLVEMEIDALNQGLGRNQLTPQRVAMALDAAVTLKGPAVKVQMPEPLSQEGGLKCRQEFCRLGCVCSSLRCMGRISLHCKQPDCIFGCTCLKRKITKQLVTRDGEDQSKPEYAVTNVGKAAEVETDTQSQKMNSSGHVKDPEQISVPEPAPISETLKRPGHLFFESMREEDKDPVYKFFESKLTCARVREFNCKPPPEVTLESSLMSATPTPNNILKPQGSDHNAPPNQCGAPESVQKAVPQEEKSAKEDSELKAKKQIHIQSACGWKEDSRMVLEGLCERMNQDRLKKPFFIGPYRINPIAKIRMHKPSGSVITYRIRISKPAKSDCCYGYLSDDLNEVNIKAEVEKLAKNRSCHKVIPFMGRVLPAGILTAATKPAGYQGPGLVTVNGKPYAQARLMLGKMGSLHPANRLAAYVTGRLSLNGDAGQKTTKANEFVVKNEHLGALHAHAGGGTTPLVVTMRKTADLKQEKQSPGSLVSSAQTNKPDASNRVFVNSTWTTQGPVAFSSIQPIIQAVPGYSPVSLTVSPSLKSPSFLAQQGTYSFRICPPSNKPGGGQNLPGVILPGGFTLIQLPKPMANEAAEQAKPPEATNTSNGSDGPARSSGAFNPSIDLAKGCIGTNFFDKVTELLGGKSSKHTLAPGHRPNIPVDENQEDSNMDAVADDCSSDYSDSGEGEEDDEQIDVETVQEQHEMTIALMKESALDASHESSYTFDSRRRLSREDKPTASHPFAEQEDGIFGRRNSRRRNTHKVLEQQRRDDERVLFDNLLTVLHSHPKTARLRLLTLAIKEIQFLKRSSKFLEETKDKLVKRKSEYIKKISTLTGKSVDLVQDKLVEIYNKQKHNDTFKCKPFFPDLQKTKAPAVESAAAPSDPQTLFQLVALVPMVTSPTTQAQGAAAAQAKDQTNAAPTSKNLQRMLTLLNPKTNLEKEPVHFENSAFMGRAKTQDKAQESESPFNYQSCRDSAAAVDPVTLSAQQLQAPKTNPESQVSSPLLANGHSLPFSTNSSQHPMGTLLSAQDSLPLVRSKTGRIILPSSLRPIGDGFYTLTVMDAGQSGAEEDTKLLSGLQTNDHGSINNPDDVTAADQTGILKSNPLKDVKCLSDLEKSSSGAALSLYGIANYKPSSRSLGMGIPRGANRARLVFSPVPPISELEPELPKALRSRGRPRKHPLNSSDANSHPAPPSEKKQKRRRRRRRGRPRSSASKRLESSTSESDEDSPVRISVSRFNNSDSAEMSRPLTRAAMGKDFPSAKKLSWEHVEKQLERDPEDE